ncbi:MAG: PH domain-containing protein [Chryseobacterium gambrini]|nr:PH domain-containing protein [Chryseobacterium gambrini]
MNSQNILYQAKIHWTLFIIPFLFTFIGVIGLLPLLFFRGFTQIIGILLVALFCKGAYAMIKLFSTKIYLTDRHLCISSGIFNKSILDISLDKIEGIELQKSLFGKILNYGNLFISTGEITQKLSICNPEEMRMKILTNNKNRNYSDVYGI